MFLLAEEAREVVGVDATIHRLYTTRALANKYGIGNIQLLHGDGRDSNTWKELPLDKKKRKQIQNTLSSSPANSVAFDRVLVDAECTHDASQRHVQKQRLLHGEFRSPWEGRESELFLLQVQLLCSGIDCCKTGGLVVYSTCSSQVAQNEAVVEEVLRRKGAAVALDLLPFSPENAGAENRAIGGAMAGSACFFDSEKTGTSGLFVCRLKKLLS